MGRGIAGFPQEHLDGVPGAFPAGRHLENGPAGRPKRNTVGLDSKVEPWRVLPSGEAGKEFSARVVLGLILSTDTTGT